MAEVQTDTKTVDASRQHLAQFVSSGMPKKAAPIKAASECSSASDSADQSATQAFRNRQGRIFRSAAYPVATGGYRAQWGDATVALRHSIPTVLRTDDGQLGSNSNVAGWAGGADNQSFPFTQIVRARKYDRVPHASVVKRAALDFSASVRTVTHSLIYRAR